ncbi:MAG TPA: CHAT domain-containing protein [Candidatus Acidoferrum sp.]|nr:CHAT domain-containing protein [Candidatus Acidoferrum sp.]
MPLSLSRTDTEVQRKMVQGLAHDFLQQFEAADSSISEAEALATTIHSSMLGDVAQARGTLELDQKKYPEAATAFRRVLGLARAQKQGSLEVLALGSMGNVAMWQEHYDEAIDWFTTALRKARDLGSLSSESRALGNMGWNYSVVGDFRSAEESLTEAESKAGQAGLVDNQIFWLTSLAGVYSQQHRYTQADATALRALTLAKGQDDQYTLTACLNTLSDIALAVGRPDEAEKYNGEALKIERAGRDQFGMASSTIISGRIAATKKQYIEAETAFQKIVGDSSVETPLRWEAQADLAQTHAAQGDASLAEREFKESIRTITKARDTVQREEFRLSFLSSAIEFYDAYVNFLIGQKRLLDALGVADLSRARTLEEGLATAADETKANSSLLRPQQLARSLKATLLFYWIGRSQSSLWVITPAKIAYFTLPKAEEIEPVVKSYQKTILGIRDAQDAGSGDGKRLYAMLVEPAKKLIPQGSRVIVLPDESLYGLNFETLVVPEPQPHFWIEDVTLTTASSLTLLERSAREKLSKGKSLLLVGNTEQSNADFPALAQAPAEMQKIEHYFPESQREVLEGKQATPSAYLRSNPERFSYLHFVTHGTASHTRPLESAVILSKEGDSYKLYARDIVTHHLNANLVTISACNGSGTRAYSGEGLVGLSWAFLRAGAHNVIGALWEVSDASTPQLMDTLYGELSQGKDPAAALRDAKLTLLHSADTKSVFRKPFYWAPFQLYAGS